MEETITEVKREESYEYNSFLNLEGVYWNEDSAYDYVNPLTIKTWIKDPMRFNKQLRALSRRLYSANGIYTNVIDYMSALPTLDSVIYSRNKSNSNYVNNKEKFIDSLEKIKHKITTRDIILKLAIDGIYFGYLQTKESNDNTKYLSDFDIDQITSLNTKEDVDFNCSVFPLPTSYCKIVGRKNSSYTIAFDLQYFDQFISNGRSLKLLKFPKEIREKYNDYRKKGDLNQKWLVLDNEKTIVCKVRSNIEELWGRQLGLAAFIDMMFDDYFTETKRGILDDVNNNIIYQTFPEGETKGNSSLSQKQQRAQHDNIKGALFNKNSKKGISFFSIAAGTKLEKIEVDTEILKTELENKLLSRIAMNLGFAGSSLNGEEGNYSSQEKNMELVASQILAWLEQIQDELNKVINLNIIKDNKCFINLYFMPTTIANRDKMVGYMKELYTLGRGSLQAWIASTGVNPEAYIALMDEELELDFDNKYPVHEISFTSPNDASTNKGGAPEKKSGLSNNTVKAKSTRNQSSKKKI